MKKLYLMALFLVPSLLVTEASFGEPGNGKNKAIKQGQKMVSLLQEVALQSRLVAIRARYNGNRQRARKFRKLAYESATLSFEVRHAIVRPLKRGVKKRRVAQNIQSVQQDVRDVRLAAKEIRVKPKKLEENLSKTIKVWQNLKQTLRSGPARGSGRR